MSDTASVYGGNVHYARINVELRPGIEVLVQETPARYGIWDAAIKARSAEDLAKFVRALAVEFAALAKDTEAYASRQNRGA